MSIVTGVYFGGELKPECPRCKRCDGKMVDCIITPIQKENGDFLEFTSIPVWYCKCRYLFAARSKGMVDLIKKHGNSINASDGALVTMGSTIIGREKAQDNELEQDVKSFKLE